MTKFDIPVRAVIDAARRKPLQRVFVIGAYPDGRLYVAGSTGSQRHIDDLEAVLEALRTGDEDVLAGAKAVA